MSIITAYKSDTDGKLFEDVDTYNAHLKKLARINRQKKKEANFETDRLVFLDKIFSQVTNPQELIDCILKNSHFFINNAKNNKKLNEKTTCKFNYLDIKSNHKSTLDQAPSLIWSNHVSNSHCAPMGHKTNWSNREKDEPNGYPGWKAYITLKLSHDVGFLTDVFNRTPINAGTGGGGTYELSLFAQDFKKMTWCEMLSDFEKTKTTNLERILHVLTISQDYVDTKCMRFNAMLSYCYKQNPQQAPQLVEKLLDLELPLKKEAQKIAKVKI